MKTVDPIMTCFKVVRINFDYWGVQGKVRPGLLWKRLLEWFGLTF